MGTKFKKGFFLFASAMLLFGAGFSFLRANDNEVVGAKAAATEEVFNFGSLGTSGNLGDNWKFTTAKNSGTNDPYSSSELRLYYSSSVSGDGCSITIEPQATNTDYYITAIDFTATSTSYVTAIDAKYGTVSPDVDVSSPAFSGTLYSFSLSEGFRTFYLQNANTSKIQLRLASVKITYALLSTKVLSSISVDSQPTKTAYFEGEVFDKSGLVVTANFDDNTSSDVTELVTISPSVMSVGVTSITLTYTFDGVEKTATINGITVEALELNSVSIKSPATKTTFSLGEEFNFDGLVLTANYNSGSEDLTSGFTVSGVDTKILGAQTATISLEDKSTTYQVTVTNENASVGDTFEYASDLIISEYVEGSGNNKVIEIYNGTGNDVDLSNYMLVQYNNGKTFDELSDSYKLTINSTLSNNSTYVIVNSGSSDAIKAIANHICSSTEYLTGFNGDDAIGLFHNDELIDLVGEIGSTVKFAEDMTLVRNPSVTSPTSTYNSSEWTVFPQDNIEHLGSHIMNLSSPNVTALEQATAFADYVMTGIGSNAAGSCQTVYPLLQTEYNYMIEDSKTIFGTSTDTLFVNARARMDLIEAYVATNGSSTMEPTEDKSGNSLQNIVLIGSLGLTALVGFYILNKKKEA
ncbi:MAG: bacterial Ig-like domain-containing protein [Bacilli bacterium]|jgi:hypothetical protein|nr:bacterial Ig-like domain-containing protein [Bacilli bacterium]MCH4235778.1 bacterial Ig-like domain-containing protein [Bacilli bacterium]